MSEFSLTESHSLYSQFGVVPQPHFQVMVPMDGASRCRPAMSQEAEGELVARLRGMLKKEGEL